MAVRDINLPAFIVVGLAHVVLLTGAAAPFSGKGLSSVKSPSSLQVALLPSTPQLPSSPTMTHIEVRSEDSPPVELRIEDNPPVTQGAPAPQPHVLAAPPAYYPADALSHMPEIEGFFEMQLPPGLAQNGQVEIRLWIDSRGNLDRVSVISTLLPPPYQHATIAAFRRMHYRPGLIGDEPVAAFVDIVVEMKGSSAVTAEAMPP